MRRTRDSRLDCGQRFARVLRYREDKRAAEADTIEAVRALRHGADAGEPDAVDPQ